MIKVLTLNAFILALNVIALGAHSILIAVGGA